MHEQIRVPELGEPIGHYSDAVRVGHLLFVSGCVPLDTAHELVGEGDVAAQTRKALENLGLVLRAAGFDYAHLAQLTIYLTDMRDAGHLSPIRREILGETRPATTVVQVAGLVLPGMRIEIDAIAALPPGD